MTNKTPITLLPVGTRISHFKGNSNTHGLGRITGYNGVTVNEYANEKFKDAAEMAVNAGLGSIFISTLYDGTRYPYKVTFDNGYSDVYDTESIKEFNGEELRLECESLKPGVKYSLLSLFTTFDNNLNDETLQADWQISGDITITSIVVNHPTLGDMTIDTSEGRLLHVGYVDPKWTNNRDIETIALKDTQGRYLYLLVEKSWFGKAIDFSLNAIVMALEEKPEEEKKHSLFGKNIRDYKQVDEGLVLVSYDIKATLIKKEES